MVRKEEKTQDDVTDFGLSNGRMEFHVLKQEDLWMGQVHRDDDSLLAGVLN